MIPFLIFILGTAFMLGGVFLMVHPWKGLTDNQRALVIAAGLLCVVSGVILAAVATPSGA